MPSLKKLIKKPVYAVMRVCPPFRKLVRKMLWSYKGKVYAKIAQETPVDEKSIVFCSFRGRSYSCSPRAIFERMEASGALEGYQVTWFFRPNVIDEYRFLEELYPNVRVVAYLRDGFYEALARAKYWITNSVSCEWVWPKPDQVYVQCWHGTPLKRLGCDIVENSTNAMNTTEEMAERYRRESSKWSYLLSPSRYTTECLASAFDLSEDFVAQRVLQLGYPRNDAIVTTSANPEVTAALRQRLSEELGFDPSKKLLLYAPTWRDSEYKAGVGYVQDVMIDFDLLQRELADEWVVLFRPHYFIANSFDFSAYEGFVANAAAPDINELYCIADALMTDYSSVFFDYACTKRPLLFYMPDLDEYERRLHGFYIDPRVELPGLICATSAEVVEAVASIDSYFDTYGEQYAAFQERFCPHEDGRAAQRVVDAVFGRGEGAE
ncbi:MAG: CDP-glycerol glycerophosphotransferase family protein [Coriobacteriales bacterium]